MKFDRIPTRRMPVRKKLHARLFNKTKAKPRKQRASAAAASADEIEESGINISRSLTIIFAIHIVAIGMIFIHKQYLSGRTAAPSSSATAEAASDPDSAAPASLPQLSNGDLTVLPGKGDNYTILAKKYNVDEADLRNANRGVAIRPGVVLRIPQGRRIVAEAPPEVEAYKKHAPQTDSERGLVEILPAVESARPQIVVPSKRQLEEAPRAAIVSPAPSGKTHTIKSGDNIWRISNEYNVSQQELMKINNITDPTKLKIGQVIKLP